MIPKMVNIISCITCMVVYSHLQLRVRNEAHKKSWGLFSEEHLPIQVAILARGFCLSCDQSLLSSIL